MGTKVFLDTILVENDMPSLAVAVADVLRGNGIYHRGIREVAVPDEATRTGVSGDVYTAWRMGLTTACADVVCVLPDESGHPVVPLIKRAAPPFKNCWWIMGGAIFNGRLVSEFLLWKLFSEGGVFSGNITTFAEQAMIDPSHPSYSGVYPVGCMGTYRTVAEDTEGTGRPPCDTINLCYLAVLPTEWRGILGHDRDHTGLRFASKIDLEPADSCGHWYPRHVGLRALQAYTMASRSLL